MKYQTWQYMVLYCFGQVEYDTLYFVTSNRIRVMTIIREGREKWQTLHHAGRYERRETCYRRNRISIHVLL